MSETRQENTACLLTKGKMEQLEHMCDMCKTLTSHQALCYIQPLGLLQIIEKMTDWFAVIMYNLYSAAFKWCVIERNGRVIGLCDLLKRKLLGAV